MWVQQDHQESGEHPQAEAHHPLGVTVSRQVAKALQAVKALQVALVSNHRPGAEVAVDRGDGASRARPLACPAASEACLRSCVTCRNYPTE